MAIKETFTTTSQRLVNFDFADILADVGYVTLFAMIDLANNELLVRQTINSNDVEISEVSDGNGLIDEKNYDFEFRIPTRLDGRCYVQITYFCFSTGVQTCNNQMKVRLLHVDTSASETEIGAQQQSVVLTETTDVTKKFANVTMSFDINQAFAKGEKFRLEVQAHSTQGTNCTVGYEIDPANRDNGQTEFPLSPNSFLKVLLPFPLET